MQHQFEDSMSKPCVDSVSFRVVLGPEWAGLSARLGPARPNAATQPGAVAQPRTTATVGGTAAGELTGDTHFIVQQPDNSVDVAIHTERLAELKAAAAAQAALNPPQVGFTIPASSRVLFQGAGPGDHHILHECACHDMLAVPGSTTRP